MLLPARKLCKNSDIHISKMASHTQPRVTAGWPATNGVGWEGGGGRGKGFLFSVLQVGTLRYYPSPLLDAFSRYWQRIFIRYRWWNTSFVSGTLLRAWWVTERKTLCWLMGWPVVPDGRVRQGRKLLYQCIQSEQRFSTKLRYLQRPRIYRFQSL
jgi:hypothetical protein